MQTKNKERAIQGTIESILKAIIDSWYERVSGYYVTGGGSDGTVSEDAELKRFHDDKGHRIKFNKDDLDFTYGLRSSWNGDQLTLEISVNNKVEHFDYDDFKRQLFAHYRKAGASTLTRPAKLKNIAHKELFQLESGISEAFTVEKRSDKADIMRLAFQINSKYLDDLAADEESTKQLIETYCVSPFRSIYAKVYRSHSS